jgi:hypothetical protein
MIDASFSAEFWLKMIDWILQGSIMTMFFREECFVGAKQRGKQHTSFA